ncbi:hypothetical protein [Microbacterium sp.]|uniref:hypothetical protein n=1 Tax=Microbacterium sp. TaxID=51671 RepID=UPI002B48BFF0|nr:hypothetical protein [Microbacterium sp.]
MIVTRSNSADRPPLRQRVRAEGGWYSWFNRNLVRMAGPAAVGPYDTTPEPPRAERPCPLCGAPMSQHTFDRTGPKPLMFCP